MAPISLLRLFLHQSASLWFRLLMKEKYVQHVLRYKIPLSIEEKEPTYLTIENYVAMEEFLWLNDHHDYAHEASRVDCSALLKMHCYTSARLQEICKAKYKV